MPSPHRRVGLVVDEPMERTLTRLAGRRPGDAARANVARRAIFEGAVLEEIFTSGTRSDAVREAAAAIRRALDELDLPEPALEAVRSQLDLAERDERRRRQRALLNAPVPAGPTAQDIVDAIEGDDDPFA